jgi:hypothetical protein
MMSAGPAPGLAGAGGVDGGLALLRRSVVGISSYGGSGPMLALGGCSGVEVRTDPEPPRMEVLGETLESTAGAESEGTVVDGTVVAPSVVTEELEPQLVHGVVTVVGLAKIGRYVVCL